MTDEEKAEEHTKKTWLDEYLDKKYLKDMGVRNPVTKGITEICKKILEEVDERHTEGEMHHCFSMYELQEIIKELGVIE